MDGAKGIVVSNGLDALCELAKFHRHRFEIPVIGITGSYGKTIVKEWLSHLLEKNHRVTRSPKSYNSRLGIALSLLEITDKTTVAIIEVGVGEMREKKKMIRPTLGVLTSFGKVHREWFLSRDEHLQEKLILFEGVTFFYPKTIEIGNEYENGILIDTENELFGFDFHLKDAISRQNVALCIAVAKRLGVSQQEIQQQLHLLPSIANRLENFKGQRGNDIINDTYRLDVETLSYSLSYQLQNSKGKKRVLLLSNQPDKELLSEIEKFEPISVFVHPDKEKINNLKNSSILIKGEHQDAKEWLRLLHKTKHQTYLEFNLKDIRHNIHWFRQQIKRETQLLCMVKASSYGADAQVIGPFLQEIGVNYLGVAYVEEGIELRKNGVQLPILIMNTEESGFEDCVNYNLEPAIYDLEQLNAFIRVLIDEHKINFPIHLKLETGMKRLGFEEEDIFALLSVLKAQPEVQVKTIYSHLAESDNESSEFTHLQFQKFEKMSNLLMQNLEEKPIRHILNSEGVINYPEYQMDMVRLGIGMYGIIENSFLRQAIGWYSQISQVKKVKKGESIGYGRSFIAEKEMQIAIIPVGYADGFRRCLSNGAGGVFIDNVFCPTVGNVCMDMIMVDISGLSDVKKGQKVEIIGQNQSVLALAKQMNTITYEVVTGFSSRLPRLYTD